MSLEQYNSLINRILNQQSTLIKLRAKIKEKKGRVYQKYKRFGHLAHNCRNRKEKMKGKPTFQNKFKIIASRVIQCGVKEGVSIRRQEIEKKRV